MGWSTLMSNFKSATFPNPHCPPTSHTSHLLHLLTCFAPLTIGPMRVLFRLPETAYTLTSFLCQLTLLLDARSYISYLGKPSWTALWVRSPSFVGIGLIFFSFTSSSRTLLSLMLYLIQISLSYWTIYSLGAGIVYLSQEKSSI